MALSSFASAIEALRPFYSLLGEAAATLLGLLFVSVTFNPHILDPSLRPGHRRYAENIFRQFVFLVWLSLVLLLPVSETELGLNLLIQSACFLIWVFISFFRSFGAARVSKDGFWWRRYPLNFLVYLGGIWAGCQLLGWGGDPSSGLTILISVSFLSLFSALYGVWRLMLSSRESKTVSPNDPASAQS